MKGEICGNDGLMEVEGESNLKGMNAPMCLCVVMRSTACSRVS